MRIEDITQPIVMICATEQERTDCCTLLEMAGVIEWGAIAHSSHKIYPYILFYPPKEFWTIQKSWVGAMHLIPASAFITDNTIKI